ncbi:MAG: DUF4232 domain-containing protein, partial [Actinomycetota bacterium]|nr:DUF4232 domain-containing protein [Actinomycetota bacterium]
GANGAGSGRAASRGSGGSGTSGVPAGAAGSVSPPLTAEVVLTNVSATPCTISGPMGLQLTAPAGHPVPAVAGASGDASSGPLAVEPGRSVVTALAWPFGAASSGCPSPVAAVVVSLPTGGTLGVSGPVERLCAVGPLSRLAFEVAGTG